MLLCTSRVAVVLWVLVSITQFGRSQQQVENTNRKTDSQPSLTETLDFMNRVLADDVSGEIRANDSNSCQISLYHYRREDITIPVDTIKVPGNYGAGIPDRWEYKWAIVAPVRGLRSDFNLKDIDPESIKADGAFSIEIIAKRTDKYEAHLPDDDRFIVHFETSNEVKAIRATDLVDESTVEKAKDGGQLGFLLEPGTTRRLVKDEHSDMFMMINRDRANRFAKAMRHAVELCGGKKSAF